jgi:hypothetical protein
MTRSKVVWLAVLCAASACGQEHRAAWHATVDSYSRLEQLFENPPKEYSTSPFLVWDAEVTEADIDYHLASYKDQGIKSFFIHPRPGMITPYLSERWFTLVRYTVNQAKQLGMEAWLYDENSYPSGFAGGHVPAQMPESFNQGQGLTLRKMTTLDANKYPLVLKKEGGGFRDVTAVESERGKSGEYYCFELAFYEKRAWHGGFSYVDLIKPGVTEKFIDITMKGYEKTLGADLGGLVPGIFTDEPNIIAPARKDCMRWTPDLFEQFQKRWGYDLRPHVPSLFEATGDWRKVRHNYYALLLDLFIDRWSRPWFAYSEKRRILWTGHYWEHGWPSPIHGPDNMAMYAWHHVPGIDMLFNQFAEGVNAQFGNVRAVKELASVANQMGRRRTLSETYGGAGWELRFEDMKRLGDWEYALGVNFMNQHLSFQTLAGARKHDYPQSFTYHEPWWKHYKVLADYFTRLSLALSAGEQVNRILVIEPTTSAWIHAGISQADPRMMELGSEFQEFLNKIEAMQVEYDLGAERLLREFGKAEGGKLRVGKRAYEVVVLPPGVENLDSATVALLEAYGRGGGKVVSFVETPGLVDGVESARVREIAAQWVKGGPLGEEDFTLVKTGGGKMFHQRRRLEGGELLFVVNSSLEEKLDAAVKARGRSVRKLDLFTGKVSGYEAEESGGSVFAKIELPPAGSALLFVSGSAGAPEPVLRAGSEQEIAPQGGMSVKRLLPNALTLDYCDLKLGGKLEKGLYYYAAAEKVFQHHGFEGNPWNTAVQYKTAILDRNKFGPQTGFEAVFRFTVGPGVERKGLRAVVERPELWKVLVNGRQVVARPKEWWLDRAFGVYEIGAQVKEGENTLTLVAQPMSVHHELEPVYLIGEFGLTAEAAGWKMGGAKPLAMGSWKEQGLPFYSWTVSYGAGYRLKKGAGRTVVKLGKWHGTVAEVLVNGKPAGVTGWAPYEVDITGAVRDGANRVEVVVYGSLKNLLGPHHGKINKGLVSPWSFRSAPERLPGGGSYDLEGYGLSEGFRVVERQ